MYSSNEIGNAIAKLWNPKKGIIDSIKVSKAYNRSTNANVKQFTWEEINEVLYAAGWAPRHLLRLLSNLKQS